MQRLIQLPSWLIAPSGFLFQQIQTLNVGFCRDSATNRRCPPSNILCNLATVSIFLVFLRGIAWGASIDVNNPSFEDPPGGKQVGVVPTGWSVQGSDFGIEGANCDGLQSLFLGKNNSGYQLTEHTIAAGDEYTLRFDAFKT